MSETYDTTELEKLGERRRRLAKELAEVDRQLKPKIILAAEARIPQDKIVGWTGYARSWVQKLEAGHRPPRWPSKDS